MQLEADRIRGEGSARQAGPLDHALALFDVLLAGAAVVVEGDDALRRTSQVGYAEFSTDRNRPAWSGTRRCRTHFRP